MYDYVAPPPALGRKADEALQRWMGVSGPRVTGVRLLIGADGQIDLDAWRRLLGERNLTLLTIRE